MNSMITFENNQVRTVARDGECWFCAKDVCKCLGLSNSRDAVLSIPSYRKGVGLTDTLGGPQKLLFVSEAGLYQLIFKSEKEEAKRFQNFVFDTVIPEYRKQQERKALEAVVVLEKEIEQLNETITALASLTNAAGSTSMREATIILKEWFYDVDEIVGRNSLFEFLRQEKIFDRNNIPYQNYAKHFVCIREGGRTIVQIKNSSIEWLKRMVDKKVEKRFVSRTHQHLISSFIFNTSE